MISTRIHRKHTGSAIKDSDIRLGSEKGLNIVYYQSPPYAAVRKNKTIHPYRLGIVEYSTSVAAFRVGSIGTDTDNCSATRMYCKLRTFL